MAAPAENENAQPAPSENESLLESANGSMATVARREKNLVSAEEERRTYLTPTGLLMEGDYTQISTYFDSLPISDSCLVDLLFHRGF
jgi:hypothetical protein